METLLVFSQDSKRTFGIQRHRIFCLIFEQFCDKFVFFKTRKDGKIPHDHRNTYPANGGRNRHSSRPPSPKSSRSSARRVLAKSSGPHRQILRMVPTRGPGADVFDLCEHLRVRRARQPPRVRSRLFDVEPSRNRGFGELNCAALTVGVRTIRKGQFDGLFRRIHGLSCHTNVLEIGGSFAHGRDQRDRIVNTKRIQYG